jgi:sialic acid synthase SpsE
MVICALHPLVIETEKAWQSLGKVSYGMTSGEEKSRIYRRSLYITKEMQAWEKFTPDNLRAIRPSLGLAPKYYDILLGKAVKSDIKAGTAVTWDLLV